MPVWRARARSGASGSTRASIESSGGLSRGSALYGRGLHDSWGEHLSYFSRGNPESCLIVPARATGTGARYLRDDGILVASSDDRLTAIDIVVASVHCPWWQGLVTATVRVEYDSNGASAGGWMLAWGKDCDSYGLRSTLLQCVVNEMPDLGDRGAGAGPDWVGRCRRALVTVTLPEGSPPLIAGTWGCEITVTPR